MSNEIKLTNTPFQNVNVSNTNSIAVGATDHSKLSNRDLADQHPISAITGLQEELESLNVKFTSDNEYGQNIEVSLEDLSSIEEGEE